jgi:uncharacterized membrane protein
MLTISLVSNVAMFVMPLLQSSTVADVRNPGYTFMYNLRLMSFDYKTLELHLPTEVSRVSAAWTTSTYVQDCDRISGGSRFRQDNALLDHSFFCKITSPWNNIRLLAIISTGLSAAALLALITLTITWWVSLGSTPRAPSILQLSRKWIRLYLSITIFSTIVLQTLMVIALTVTVTRQIPTWPMPLSFAIGYFTIYASILCQIHAFLFLATGHSRIFGVYTMGDLETPQETLDEMAVKDIADDGSDVVTGGLHEIDNESEYSDHTLVPVMNLTS